jgi:hypothetical protein
VTDTQLYFAIGIPSALFALNFLAVLAAAFWQAKRFDDMKDLFKAEIGRVEGELRADLGRVEGSLKGEMSSLRSELQRVDGVLSAKLDSLTARVTALETRLEGSQIVLAPR